MDIGEVGLATKRLEPPSFGQSGRKLERRRPLTARPTSRLGQAPVMRRNDGEHRGFLVWPSQQADEHPETEQQLERKSNDKEVGVALLQDNGSKKGKQDQAVCGNSK